MKEMYQSTLTYKQEESKMDKIKNTIRESIFCLMHILLKQPEITTWLQILIILIQMMQLLAFSMSLIFQSIWKQEDNYKPLAYFFQYFQLVFFFLDNSLNHLIIFYICMFFVLLILIWFIYSAVMTSRNKIGKNWLLSSLRMTLIYISTVFCLPIIQLFLSIFNCMKREDITRDILDSHTTTITQLRLLNSTEVEIDNTLVNYYEPNMICYQSIHIIHCVFGGLFAFVFIGFVYFIIQTSYKSKIYNISLTSKCNSSFDMILFITKVVLCILFSFFGIKQNDMILIAFLIFFSFLLFFSYISYNIYFTKSLHMLYSLLVMVFAWANICLLIGKVFVNSVYNGCMPLFFLGIPIIILITVFENRYQKSILKYQLGSFKTGKDAMNQIKALLYLVNAKDKDGRSTQLILNGYIREYESTCLIPQCPLKKYLLQSNPGEEVYSFIIYHIENVFKLFLNKFPTCVLLRLSYVFFLYEYLKKKKKAVSVLESVTNYNPTYEEMFIIYHTKKSIEENEMNKESEEKIDVVANITYKQYLIEFKSTMIKITFLYIEFWTLLLSSFEDQDNLEKLNDFGTKIIGYVEALNKLLDKIQAINPNDQEVLYYYSDFLNDILNEKDKAMTYKSKLTDVKEANEINEVNYINLDYDMLSSSDEYQYIVISGGNDSFCNITTISLGLCLVLGYSKTELIGKSIDVIMPNVFHKIHRKLLIDKVNAFRNEYANINSYQNYKPKFKDITSFARTKARYLVYIPFQVTLLLTESQGILFIAKINAEQLSLSINQSSVCYLLTNNTFIIQNFTVNSVHLLGMNSYVLNNAVDVTSFIKQIHEDCLQETSKMENLTPEDKITIKKQVITQKYKMTKVINWKRHELNDQRFISSSKIPEYNTSLVSLSNSNTNINLTTNNNNYNNTHFSVTIDANASVTANGNVTRKSTHQQDSFFLTIHNVILGGKQEGYVFKLEVNNAINQNQGNAPQRLSTKDITNVIRRKLSEKSSTLMNNSNSEMQYDKYKAFIPEGKSNFVLDTQKMSFIPHYNRTNQREDLKYKALQKVRTINTITTTIIAEDSYEGTSSDLTNGEYSSSVDIESEEEAMDNTPNINNTNSFKLNINGTVNVNEEYYRVDFSKIKYSIYSYEKKTVIEVSNYPKKTQLELKMCDDGNEDDKDKDQLQSKISLENANIFKEDNKNKKDIAKEELLKQQITIALSKEESLTIIILLRLVVILIVLLLLGLEGGLIYILYDSRIKLFHSTLLISNTYLILFNCLKSHSAIRDLSLLSNENYTAYEGTKEEEILNSLQMITDLYNDTTSLINSIIVNDVKAYLTPADFFTFYNETMELSIVKPDLTISKYNSTLLSALSQASASIFHIFNDNVDYLPINNYVFFYIENFNNNLSNKLNKQIEIFINAFFVVKSAKFFNFAMLLTLTFVLEIIMFVAFNYTYQSVAKSKESYLEVFFEIESKVIKSSLDKCENFAKKIQLQTFKEFIVNDDEIEYDDILTNTPSAKANNKNKKNAKTVNNKKKTSKETQLINILFGLFLILVGIFKILDLIFFHLFLKKLTIYIRIFRSENDAFIEYVFLYRNIKEYFFDNNVLINNTNVVDFFPRYIKDFYFDVIQKRSVSVLHKNNFPSQYQITNHLLYNNELCTGTTKEKVICDDQVIQAVSAYGLKTVLPFFVEEIRVLRNVKIIRDLNAIQSGFQHNLTLTGLFDYYLLFPDDPSKLNAYFANSPLNLYNNHIYTRIKGIYNHLIIPSFVTLFNLFGVCINDYIDINMIIFYSLSGIIMFLTIIVYFGVWRPFESKLNKLLFKTKNLLSIIPKEFLASLSVIHKLLNLNQSFSKVAYSYKK